MKEFKLSSILGLMSVRNASLKKSAVHSDVSKGVERKGSSLDEAKRKSEELECGLACEQLYSLTLSAIGSLDGDAGEAEMSAAIARAQAEADQGELARIAGGTWQLGIEGLMFQRADHIGAGTEAQPIDDSVIATPFGITVGQWLAFGRRARRAAASSADSGH